MEELLSVCQKVSEHPGSAHKQMMLAVEVVKLRNKHKLDLGNPASLCAQGKNPLYEACRAGNIPLVKLFLSSGAQLNVLDLNGVSPLYHAMTSYHGSHKMVDFLLSAGSNPNLFNQGKCPLLASFYSMKIDTSLMLIKRGADVNNVILPSFCFVETVFTLNFNLVMIASGVRFNLEEFDQLTYLASEIIYAGLHPRTFYLHGRRFIRGGLTEKEMKVLWAFQCLCIAAGFKVDVRSIREVLVDIDNAIPSVTDASHLSLLKEHRNKLVTIMSTVVSPLSLTRLCRLSIREYFVADSVANSNWNSNSKTGPSKPAPNRPVSHIGAKISLLPLPQICKDFLLLHTL